jgi:hypothetical protein
VTKLADAQKFWRGNKINTDGTNWQPAAQRAAKCVRDSKFCAVRLASLDFSDEHSDFIANRWKVWAEHKVLHTSQETLTALHDDSTWTVGDTRTWVSQNTQFWSGSPTVCSGGPTGSQNAHLCCALSRDSDLSSSHLTSVLT